MMIGTYGTLGVQTSGFLDPLLPSGVNRPDTDSDAKLRRRRPRQRQPPTATTDAGHRTPTKPIRHADADADRTR
jgi:hypothetical protein